MADDPKQVAQEAMIQARQLVELAGRFTDGGDPLKQLKQRGLVKGS